MAKINEHINDHMTTTTYQSLCAQFYDLDKPTPSSRVLTFYHYFASQAQGPILEPMCGTGRYLLSLYRDGFDIEGFDASPHMISILHEKALEERMTPNVEVKNILDPITTQGYRLVIIPEGSIALLGYDDDVDYCFESIYQALEKGGRFVFDAETLLAAPTEYNAWQGRLREKDSQTQILLSTLNLPVKERMSQTICRYELIESGVVTKAQVETIRVRLYDPNRLRNRLIDHGFEVTCHQAYQLNVAPSTSDPVVVFDCVKP